MSKIQTVILPYEDEYLYGYLRRLAFVNGMNFDDFCRHLLRSNRIRQVSSDSCSRYDCVQPLYSLFHQMNCIHTPEHPEIDPLKLYMDTSIYHCFAPLMNEVQQSDWILRVFDRNAESTSLISDHHKDSLNTLRICPECAAADKETYGFPLIHRSHQYPRQTICLKHQRKLLEYTGKKGNEFSSEEYLEEFSPVSLGHSFKTELEFSEFVSEFSELNLQCDILDIAVAVRARCDELGVNADIQRSFNKLPYGKRARWMNEDLIPKLRLFQKKFGEYQRTVDPAATLQILYVLFEKTEDIKKYLPDDSEENEENISLIEKEGYSLVSEYNSTVIHLMHNQCGTRFVTTPAAFKLGFRCPFCQEDMTDQERFRYMFAVQTMGEYQLLSDFKEIRKPVTVKHVKCGKTYDVSAGSFIKKGVRCDCWYGSENRKTALARMQEHPDFRLITFTAMNEPVRIRCLKCNTILEFRDMFRFMDRPSCRVCEPYFYDGKRLEKIMRDLVGDEYTISPKEFISMHTPMPITHNLCGSTESYAPIEFTRGRRCKYCNSATLTSEQVSSLLSAQTNGRYTVEGFNTESGSRYIVKDNETGKTMSLLKAQIVQELRRPTPSDIFENHTPVGFSDPGRLANWISRKPDMSWFTLASAALELRATQEELETELAELCMKRVIQEIQHGHRIYQVIGREADPESIVEEVLLKDSAGNPIGYFTGSSFLRSLGVEGKSDSIGFISNLYRGKTKAHFILDGIRCNATGPKYGDVTNENYAILQIISWIIGSSFTMKNKEVVKAVLGYMREKGLDESDIEPYKEMVHPRTVERYLRLVELMKE